MFQIIEPPEPSFPPPPPPMPSAPPPSHNGWGMDQQQSVEGWDDDDWDDDDDNSSTSTDRAPNSYSNSQPGQVYKISMAVDDYDGWFSEIIVVLFI